MKMRNGSVITLLYFFVANESGDLPGGRRDQVFPRLIFNLTPDIHLRIPWAFFLPCEPVPDLCETVRHKNPCRAPKRARQMCGCIAHRDDNIAGAYQCSKTVNVLGIVDIFKPSHGDADCL